MKFTKTELKQIILSILVVTLAFAYDDKSPTFNLVNWLFNFLGILIIITIAYLVHILAHKLVSNRYKCTAEFRIWSVKRFWLSKGAVFPRQIQLGSILPLLVALLSNGTYFFIISETFELSIEKIHRLGRKFIRLTEWEEAKIAIAGPLANIILMLITAIFNSSGIFDQFIFINGMIAIFHILPLPRLDGIKILYGSIPLYIFTLSFTILLIILINTISPLIALILTIIITITITILYYYLSIYKTKK